MPSNMPTDLAMNAIDKFIQGIVYTPDYVRWAAAAQLAVGHATGEVFPTRGHFLVTAKTKGCGKTTLAHDVPMLLALAPWKVGKQTTDPAIMHKFFEDIPPTLLCDDIGKIFGDAGNNGKTSTLYAILIDGYRMTATVSMSRGGVTQDIPAYAMAWMNGLHKAVPGDLASRAIRAHAVKRPKNVKLRSALHPDTKAEAEQLRTLLHVWVAQNKEQMAWFVLNRAQGLHPKLYDRELEIWGPLFAVADAAGGEWPERIMTAFVTMELDATDRPMVTPDQQLILDVAKLCKDYHVQRTFVADLVGELRLLPESPYHMVSDRRMVERLVDVLGEYTHIRGRDFAGEQNQGMGWLAQPVFKGAAQIKALSYTAPADNGPSELELAMAKTKIGA